jgi:hypothetical protein
MVKVASGRPAKRSVVLDIDKCPVTGRGSKLTAREKSFILHVHNNLKKLWAEKQNEQPTTLTGYFERVTGLYRKVLPSIRIEAREDGHLSERKGGVRGDAEKWRARAPFLVHVDQCRGPGGLGWSAGVRDCAYANLHLWRSGSPLLNPHGSGRNLADLRVAVELRRQSGM